LLDRVSNVVLGLDGRGNAQLFADYLQWEEWKGQGLGIREQGLEDKGAKVGTSPSAGSKKKLSYLEQREFDAIEARVEAADARLAAAHDRVADPTVAVDAAALTLALAEMEAAQVEHDAIYERWAELTEKAG
jgi:ATP-binding cassette subfamily F protein uup